LLFHPGLKNWDTIFPTEGVTFGLIVRMKAAAMVSIVVDYPLEVLRFRFLADPQVQVPPQILHIPTRLNQQG